MLGVIMGRVVEKGKREKEEKNQEVQGRNK